MAEAIASLTVNPWPNGVDNTQTRVIINGKCVLSAAGTYATNGIPLNWQTMLDGNFPNAGTGQYFTPKWGSTQTAPLVASFFSVSGGANGATALQNYLYDPVHNTLRIFEGGVELANLAAINADTIAFEAEFIRGR